LLDGLPCREAREPFERVSLAREGTAVHDLEADDLKIAVVQSPGAAAIELHWTGKSNDRQPGRVFSPFLRKALAHAVQQGRSLEMHFERIAHFNSSTIAALIEFIIEARGKGVGLDIVYDEKLKWQRLSFDTLKKVTAKDSAIRLRSI
jgi:hypothetical protein